MKKLAFIAVAFGALFCAIPAINFLAHGGEICAQGINQQQATCSTHSLGQYFFAFWLRSLDLYNGLIQGIAAIATVGFTVLLWRVADRQREISVQQAALMEKQLNVMALQTDILNKQKEIQRQEFLATHRPRLRIREIAFNWDPEQLNDMTRVYFCVVNGGETVAEDIEMKSEIFFRDGDFWDKPVLNKLNSTNPRNLPAIESGERQECSVEHMTDVKTTVGVLRKQGILTRETNLFIAGRITYKSSVGTAYCTCFVRQFDVHKNVFIPSNNQEENYED